MTATRMQSEKFSILVTRQTQMIPAIRHNKRTMIPIWKMHPILNSRYRLHDRPFRKRADYDQSIGKLLRTKVRPSGKGKPVLVGRLSLVDETGIVLVVMSGKQGLPVRVPWDDIVETKLEIEF